MIAILYPLKMDKNLSEAYSSIYKEGTKYGLTKGTGKPGGAMKDYLDKKAKQLEDEKKKQKPEYRNNPAFGDPSHHSNAKSKNEEFVAERRGSSPEKLKQNRDKAFTPKKPLKDTGNPLQNAWNKFVPPPESSNNPNVRSGKLKPGKLEAGYLKNMNKTMKNVNKPIKAASQTYKKGKKVISTAIQKVDKLNKMADKLPGQVKTGAKIALGAGAAVLGAKALMDRRKKKKEDQMRQKNEGTFRAEWEAFKLIEREDYIERFENWKNGLVEEGYDVSRWSKEDLVETFITENDLFSSQQSIIDALFEADKKGKGSGTKDACYHKVKSRYSVWPSAYASGALVKCRKKGAKNWGNSSKKEDFSNWREDLGLLDENRAAAYTAGMSPEQKDVEMRKISPKVADSAGRSHDKFMFGSRKKGGEGNRKYEKEIRKSIPSDKPNRNKTGRGTPVSYRKGYEDQDLGRYKSEIRQGKGSFKDLGKKK